MVVPGTTTVPAGCMFCNPDPALVIGQHRSAFALVFSEPIRPGHITVGVRAHKPFLQDITPEEAADVLSYANQLSRRLVEEYSAEKIYVFAVGDASEHFHLHLVPKSSSDPRLGPFLFGDSGWASKVGAKFPEEARRRLAVLLRSAV